MSNKGTIIGAPIKQVDSNSLYPVAFSNDINGGLHFKLTIVDRNNIPNHNRQWGMLVYVEFDKKTYQLYQNNLNINDNTNWVEFSSGAGSSDPFFFNITKSDLDTLISTESLVPGAMYCINGVDMDLYNGAVSPLNFPLTTIWLKAISIKELDSSGVGRFYNPKYDYSLSNNGIYNKLVKFNFNFDNVSNFENRYRNMALTDTVPGYYLRLFGFSTIYSEYHLEADPTILFTNLDYIAPLHGILDVITVNPLENILNPDGSFERVIWGGYYWDNKSGYIGRALDDYSLNSDWELLDFDYDDYDVTFDLIKYDYYNDKIYSREDVNCNKVEFNVDTLNEVININGESVIFENPIKKFQWNNNRNITSGVRNCVVYDSIFDNLNSMADLIDNIHLTNKSIISKNILYGKTKLTGLKLHNSSFIKNNVFDSDLLDFDFKSSHFFENTLEGSYVSNLNYISSSEYKLSIHPYTDGSYVDHGYVMPIHSNIKLLNYSWDRSSDVYDYNEHTHTEKKGDYVVDNECDFYYGYNSSNGNVVLVEKSLKEKNIIIPNDTVVTFHLIGGIIINGIITNADPYLSREENHEAYDIGDYSLSINRGSSEEFSIPFGEYLEHINNTLASPQPIAITIKTPGYPIDVTISYKQF